MLEEQHVSSILRNVVLAILILRPVSTHIVHGYHIAKMDSIVSIYYCSLFTTLLSYPFALKYISLYYS